MCYYSDDFNFRSIATKHLQQFESGQQQAIIPNIKTLIKSKNLLLGFIDTIIYICQDQE